MEARQAHRGRHQGPDVEVQELIPPLKAPLEMTRRLDQTGIPNRRVAGSGNLFASVTSLPQPFALPAIKTRPLSRAGQGSRQLDSTFGW